MRKIILPIMAGIIKIMLFIFGGFAPNNPVILEARAALDAYERRGAG